MIIIIIIVPNATVITETGRKHDFLDKKVEFGIENL
jgi:hypothetical protein